MLSHLDKTWKHKETGYYVGYCFPPEESIFHRVYVGVPRKSYLFGFAVVPEFPLRIATTNLGEGETVPTDDEGNKLWWFGFLIEDDEKAIVEAGNYNAKLLGTLECIG